MARPVPGCMKMVLQVAAGDIGQLTYLEQPVTANHPGYRPTPASLRRWPPHGARGERATCASRPHPGRRP